MASNPFPILPASGGFSATGGAWGTSGITWGLTEEEIAEKERIYRFENATTLKDHIDNWIPPIKNRNKKW
jgi:hypothetical protein